MRLDINENGNKFWFKDGKYHRDTKYYCELPKAKGLGFLLRLLCKNGE